MNLICFFFFLPLGSGGEVQCSCPPFECLCLSPSVAPLPSVPHYMGSSYVPNPKFCNPATANGTGSSSSSAHHDSNEVSELSTSIDYITESVLQALDNILQPEDGKCYASNGSPTHGPDNSNGEISATSTNRVEFSSQAQQPSYQHVSAGHRSSSVSLPQRYYWEDAWYAMPDCPTSYASSISTYDGSYVPNVTTMEKFYSDHPSAHSRTSDSFWSSNNFTICPSLTEDRFRCERRLEDDGIMASSTTRQDSTSGPLANPLDDLEVLQPSDIICLDKPVRSAHIPSSSELLWNQNGSNSRQQISNEASLLSEASSSSPRSPPHSSATSNLWTTPLVPPYDTRIAEPGGYQWSSGIPEVREETITPTYSMVESLSPTTAIFSSFNLMDSCSQQQHRPVSQEGVSQPTCSRSHSRSELSHCHPHSWTKSTDATAAVIPMPVIQ